MATRVIHIVPTGEPEIAKFTTEGLSHLPCAVLPYREVVKWVPESPTTVFGDWHTVKTEELPAYYVPEYSGGLFGRLTRMVPVRRFIFTERRRVATTWVDEDQGPMGSVVTEERRVAE